MTAITLEGLMVGLGIALGSVILAPIVLRFLVQEEHIQEFLSNYRSRVKKMFPYALLLLLIPVFNVLLRNLFENVFDSNGVEITPLIYGFEGYIVSFLQQFATPMMTTVMTFVYVFIYVFIVFLTALVYLFDPDEIHLKELCVALAFNYLIGLLSYSVFIAYGPRVFIDHAVQGLMYQAYPFVWDFTSIVNTPSNVFPSVHASMSVTVALFSLSTRDKFPLLPYIVATSAVMVIISTMYLGIHWFIDVVAGIFLGSASFYVGKNYTRVVEAFNRRSNP